MKRLRDRELQQLGLLSELAYCNPFFLERFTLERQVLGKQFDDEDTSAWSFRSTLDSGRPVDPRHRPNVVRLATLATDLVERFLWQVQGGENFQEKQLSQYWDVVTYALMYRYFVNVDLDSLFESATTASLWQEFLVDYQRLTNFSAIRKVQIQAPAHLFSCLCQVRRAFYNIYSFILGESFPSVALRGAVWQSIFTIDLRRYRRSLFNRMSEFPSLITGPSGTGKELVARAIGLSQYIPFDEQKLQFAETSQAHFFPLNLSAMSASLIESELFGHRKGAFTAAISDRQGWLELCPPHGAIFLDEIGELDSTLQVKLLRVVQQRTYSRLGESTESRFYGKIIGATNREMDLEIAAGRFREDLYYRLCADRIQTPSLRQQLDDRPDDLMSLTMALSSRLVGDRTDEFCDQAMNWIVANLGPTYPWPGNIRELEQCLCSLLIRGVYVPSGSSNRGDLQPKIPLSASATVAHAMPASFPSWLGKVVGGTLTVEQLLQHYCAWVYQQSGSYDSAAKRLKIDRRTVKSRVEANAPLE